MTEAVDDVAALLVEAAAVVPVGAEVVAAGCGWAD